MATLVYKSGGASTQNPLYLIGISSERLELVSNASSPAFTFRSLSAFNISEVRGSLTTASTAGIVEIDIKKNGVSIFSTRLTIDANSKTSVGATTPHVISDNVVVDDDELSIYVTLSGAGAFGLNVSIF